MTYNEAMALLYKHPSRHIVKRPDTPGIGVAIRFGIPQILRGPRSMISYTPTLEDMKATDWEVVR